MLRLGEGGLNLPYLTPFYMIQPFKPQNQTFQSKTK